MILNTGADLSGGRCNGRLQRTRRVDAEVEIDLCGVCICIDRGVHIGRSICIRIGRGIRIQVEVDVEVEIDLCGVHICLRIRMPIRRIVYIHTYIDDCFIFGKIHLREFPKLKCIDQSFRCKPCINLI